jgi:hypothetical protein
MNGSKLILDSIGLPSLSNSRSCCSADNKDAKYDLKVRFPVRTAFLIFVEDWESHNVACF